MATYVKIAEWITQKYGYVPKTCWIAHVKAECGLPVRQAPNRRDPSRREVPCPDEKKPHIVAVFRHFKML